MLRDAGQLMYQASQTYLNVLKKSNDKNADQWISRKHKTFNQQIDDIVRRVKSDIGVSIKLNKRMNDMKKPLVATI